MKTNLNSLALLLVVTLAVAMPSRQAAAQLPFSIGQQLMRNVAPQPRQTTTYLPAVQNRNYGAANSTSNPGLSFGSKKSSVAISLGPGGVGVGVGTKDAAVAVAVGGGGVGVGVATESGTAVSVGAAGGGVSVGVSQRPEYQLFGAPNTFSPAVQGNAATLNAGTPRFSGRSLSSTTATPRFGTKAGYWNFQK